MAQYGLSIPTWDDWNIIPYAAGREPITWGWLWSFHMDHRIPLPRLLFVALFRLSGGDVRAVMLLNVLLLSGAALLGMLVARQRTGHTRVTDALIPLSLVGIANYANLLSANQIQYISSIALFAVVVYLLMGRPEWFGLSTVAVIGICSICLPLTGSTGLALTIPQIAVLPLAAWQHRERRERSVRLARWLAVLVAVVLVALVAAYNVFGERPDSAVSQPASSIQEMFVTIAQFAAVSFAAPPFSFSTPARLSNSLPGMVTAYFSADWVARTWRLRAVVLLGALGIAVIGLALPVVRRQRPMRQALGALGCLAAVGTLAFAIGYARGSALEQRYITLGAVLLVVTYLCLRLVRHSAATAASWALLMISLVLLPWNVFQAISFGETRRAFEADLVSDIRAGVPVDVLGTRYYEHLWGDPSLATSVLKEMRDDNIGPFASGDLVLNEAPPAVVAEQPLSTAPTSAHNMSLFEDQWSGRGSDSYLLYAVDSPRVAGVRLKYRLSNATSSPALLQVAWSESSAPEFDQPGHAFVRSSARADGQPEEVVAWIDAPVNTLRVTPDNKATSFTLDEIVLLLSSS
ncbi:MAG: hypothetical protein JOZ81_10390 [Chloroflexi bacterium]|nr:hypothetical protein [Chloroflexota bacterium]